MFQNGELKVPAINVNDSVTKVMLAACVQLTSTWVSQTYSGSLGVLIDKKIIVFYWIINQKLAWRIIHYTREHTSLPIYVVQKITITCAQKIGKSSFKFRKLFIAVLFIELKQPNLAELCSLKTCINPVNLVKIAQSSWKYPT